jgi:hypothetical protein
MSATNTLNSAIVQLGNYRGVYLWRNNTGALRAGKNGERFVRFGKVGSGDVIGVYHGYFVSIETKVGRDTASQAQIEFAANVQAAGGYAIFARDVDDAAELFDMIDQRVAVIDGAQEIPF